MALRHPSPEHSVETLQYRDVANEVEFIEEVYCEFGSVNLFKQIVATLSAGDVCSESKKWATKYMNIRLNPLCSRNYAAKLQH
jgi:hypothetical protein